MAEEVAAKAAIGASRSTAEEEEEGIRVERVVQVQAVAHLLCLIHSTARA